MSDTMRLLLFVLGYVVLMRWLLPWLGVRTCMSGHCNVPLSRKPTAKHETEKTSGEVAHPAPER